MTKSFNQLLQKGHTRLSLLFAVSIVVERLLALGLLVVVAALYNTDSVTDIFFLVQGVHFVLSTAASESVFSVRMSVPGRFYDSALPCVVPASSIVVSAVWGSPLAAIEFAVLFGTLKTIGVGFSGTEAAIQSALLGLSVILGCMSSVMCAALVSRGYGLLGTSKYALIPMLGLLGFLVTPGELIGRFALSVFLGHLVFIVCILILLAVKNFLGFLDNGEDPLRGKYSEYWYQVGSSVIAQFSVLIERYCGKVLLAPGQLSAIAYIRSLVAAPQVMGAAMANGAMPHLVEAKARSSQFVDEFLISYRKIVYLTTWIVLALLAVGPFIVVTLYGPGNVEAVPNWQVILYLYLLTGGLASLNFIITKLYYINGASSRLLKRSVILLITLPVCLILFFQAFETAGFPLSSALVAALSLLIGILDGLKDEGRLGRKAGALTGGSLILMVVVIITISII